MPATMRFSALRELYAVRVMTEEGEAGVYTTTTRSLAPCLEVTKQAVYFKGFPGSVLIYTLTASNTFSSALAGIVLTDTSPLSATFAWASGNYTRTDGMVTWTAENLAPQEALTATLAVSVAHLPSGLNVVNTDYGAHAGEFCAPVIGAPVEVMIPWRRIFPFVSKGWPGGNNSD